MNAWKKGAIIGAVLSIVVAIGLGIISLGYYNPLGLATKGFLYFWGFHILVGGVFGSVVGLLIESYSKRERKISIKFPIAGFVLVFLIQYAIKIFLVYQQYYYFHPNVFRTIIVAPLALIFSVKSLFYNVIGLILGYLVGYIIVRRREPKRG